MYILRVDWFFFFRESRALSVTKDFLTCCLDLGLLFLVLRVCQPQRRVSRCVTIDKVKQGHKNEEEQ